MAVLFPKSNFQAGIIFVLIVAIPFLFFLITIHILYGVVWNKSENCSEICNINPNASKYFIPKKGGKDKRSVIYTPDEFTNFLPYKLYNLWQNETLVNPAIAALVQTDRFSTTKSLKCSIGIIHSNMALTTSKCINSSVPLDNIRVRLGSNYWWRDGIVKMLTNVTCKESNDTKNAEEWCIVVFEAPKLKELAAFNTLSIPNDRTSIANRSAYFWRSGLASDHLEEWSLPKAAIGRELRASKVYYSCGGKSNADLSGAPIVGGSYLVGVHVRRGFGGEFDCYYRQTTELISWLTKNFLMLPLHF